MPANGDITPRPARLGARLVALGLATLACWLASLAAGSAQIPFTEVVQILVGGDAQHPPWQRIVLDFLEGRR